MIQVHRAERTAELAAGLASVLAATGPDPFTAEVVAVPTKGVERWLAQRLSHSLGANTGDGVCANVVFPSPAKMLAGALTAGSGVDPDDDPWAVGRTTWTLLDVIDRCSDEAWCAPLAAHLGEAEHVPGRRLTTAQRLARLFQSYAVSRPQMLRDWAGGRDTDGTGAAVPQDLAWQPELWRRLHQAIGTDSLAERLPQACDAIRSNPERLDLPDRISLFGPTRLTAAQLDILDALATHRDVHLWLPHPSPALWATLQQHELTTTRRRDDTTADDAANPLLASLGRDVRELQLRLKAYEHTDEHVPAAEPPPDTLLTRLQRSIRDDGVPAQSTVDSKDRSLQVHACHGPARQVEVLREVLVGLLADDPTLEPRDVLVMCPNIEDYAPLISATFGLVDHEHETDAHPGHRLRVRLADRSLRQTNPLLGLIAALLDLAGGRVTATQVLDLAALAPVRRRFAFSDDNLELLQTWVATSGVRWGLDGDHRAPFRLDGIHQNTWQAGLDRVLLGAAMADDGLRWVDRALPLDDVDSNDIDLAGRLAELIARLHEILDNLTGTHPLTHWVDVLTASFDQLGDVSDNDAWQKAQATRELAEILDDAGTHATSSTLTLGDVQALLADRLAGRPTRANFRTGNLTMCSMVPMRSVPHRVICLLGLDDGAFPRGAGTDGDDILARDPWLGERDPRSEDRQLLLDALMAAREHLVLLYSGADPRTNALRPPAVPVGEILDAVDAIATTYDAQPVREHVVTKHPLQPFDRRNFILGALGTPRPFSFDRLSLDGARRAAQPRDDDEAFLTAPLPVPATPGDVTLDEVIGFLEHPAKAFLRQRLGITVRDDDGGDDDPSDELCVELEALDKWAIGERLLQAQLRGADARTCSDAEWRRGTLPPGELGKRVFARVIGEVEPLAAACAAYVTVDGASVDAVVDLDARRIVGTVVNVRGDVILRATYSTLAAKHRLRAWAQLLALTAAHPERQLTAVTIGKAKNGGRRSMLGPIDPADARSLLADLVELRDGGLCCVLPMVTKASATYADFRKRGFDEEPALGKARTEWSGGSFPERADAAYRIVYGDKPDFDVLLGDPAEVDPDETTRFGEIAQRVWEPLLQHEKLEAV